MLTTNRIAVLGALFLLGIVVSLSTTSCCPPNCPPIPPAFSPMSWDPLLDEADYETIIAETNSVIEKGEGTEFYAEARLYRGLALLKSGGDLEDTKADLEFAQTQFDTLNSVDLKKEQTLLLRGLMVTYTKLGDIGLAEEYKGRAIELSPEQSDIILREFEDAAGQ
ncbi:MAG: hypothetical protein AB1649_12720 [Chloroflexota bacterium]